MSTYFHPMAPRQITSANYITYVNGTPHPDRIMKEHDFLYMIEGGWEIYEDGKRYEMRSDDLLILPAGRHHYGKSLCTPNNRHMYIHLTPLPDDRRGSSLASHFDSLIHCQAYPKICGLFEEIIATQWRESARKEDKLSLLMNLLLCELLDMQTLPIAPVSGSAGLVAKITHLFQITPQTFFTNKELADKFFVCERTLSNQFKKAYGKTLYAYQMDVKLEKVRQFLLMQPDVKLHETALNFGFYDEFHLSRAFHKKYGMPPGQYREKALAQRNG